MFISSVVGLLHSSNWRYSQVCPVPRNRDLTGTQVEPGPNYIPSFWSTAFYIGSNYLLAPFMSGPLI